MLKKIYGRVQYLGRKGEFKEYKRNNQRIQEGISTRYGRHSETRIRERNV